MERRFARLQRELAAHRIRVPVTGYLAEEWFTPDGSTAIAVPFYLAHPRLVRLERAQMGDVEGGRADHCMRILRHEAGHVIDNAFALRRERRRQRVFGRSSTPYPTWYVPDPGSRRHVRHLDFWYGQSHPDEDFAETFAVWLTPHTDWPDRYAGTPALGKLRYVDRVMATLRDERPVMARRTEVEPLRHSTVTLRQYYVRKRHRYATGYPVLSDRVVHRLFPDRAGTTDAPLASVWLTRRRRALAADVAEAGGVPRVAATLILDDLRQRCRTDRRRLQASPRETEARIVRACARLVRQALRDGTWRIAL